MKVLVAGATGVVGLQVIRELVARGHEVTGLMRRAGRRGLLEELGAGWVTADAMDAGAIAQAVTAAGPEVVVDLLTAVPDGGPWRSEDMEATNRLRVAGTRHLLGAVVEAGVRRYVAESSFLIYSSARCAAKPVSEHDDVPARPPASALCEVVAALAAKEQSVLEAASAGLEVVVLRFGSCYGPGPAIDAMVGRLRARRLPVAWRARGAVPWLHVTEAAAALVAAVEHGRAGGVYNIAENEPLSFPDFLRCLAGAAGASAPGPVPRWIVRVNAPYVLAALTDPQIRVSTRRARDELGWVPRFTSPREGLAEMSATLRRLPTPPSAPKAGAESTGTILVALATNVIMMGAKAFAAALTASPALFAETLHSLADTGNEVLLVTAQRRSRRPADLRHPYGYGSELFFWSLLAALGIFLAGGVLAIWEGIQQLLHPGQAAGFAVGYIVLGIGFAVDGTSWLRSRHQLAREARARGVPLNQHVQDTTDTTVTAVYLEDGAALLGGLIATAGLAAHQALRSAVPDAVAAVIIGTLLGAIGLRLARRNRDLLTGLSESPLVVDQIRDLLLAQPEITAVGKIATAYLGPHQLLVTADIQPEDDLSGLRQRQLITELCERIIEAIPRAAAVYLMPVLTATAPPPLTAFDTDYQLRHHPHPEQY